MKISLLRKLFFTTIPLAGALLVACGSVPESSGQEVGSPPAAAIAQATIIPSPTSAPTATAAPTTTPVPTEAHNHDVMPEATAPADARPAGAQVPADIKLFQFKPNPLEVAVGSTVVWTNQDDIEHSVTHGTPTAPGSAFDSGLFSKGEVFSFTFTTPGEYLYFCTRHKSMQGRVNVTNANSAATVGAAQAQIKPGVPERLVIPAIKLDVKPVAVGLDTQGVPIVPRHDVGWFINSARPGQGSNTVFWGHVLRWKETPAKAAPFERVHELRPGAEIVVFNDQRPRRYQVTEQIQVRPENVAYLLPTAEEQLTFVSCIGDNVIVAGTLTKEYRLVTIAQPLT